MRNSHQSRKGKPEAAVGGPCILVEPQIQQQHGSTQVSRTDPLAFVE
jgi:hypothetical protein